MLTRRQILLLGGLAAIAAGVGGCSQRVKDAHELLGSTALLDLPLEDAPGFDLAARGSANLGWELLASDPNPNRVIAPSSLAVTLGILAEGATDETLDAIDATFVLLGDERATALGALRQSLARYDSLPKSVDVDSPPKDPVVHQASQAVIVEGKHVEQAFLDRIMAYYGVGMAQVPPEGMKRVLDEWASTHTAGLIKESAIDVVPNLVLVLQDAILFAAAWAEEFPNDDRPLEFHAPDGVQQIQALWGEFSVPWAEGEGWTAVRLPYDDTLAMDVILPAPDTAPDQLAAGQMEQVRKALDTAQQRKVSVTLPPIDLTGKIDLLQTLAQHGITFGNSVDGIFPGAVIDQFVQQVRLMVSAKGTVGAALTEVAVLESEALPDPETIEMVVDRPFAVRVLDTRTGWPLFLAVISDATEAAP